MAEDGQTLAVGAPLGSSQGSVRVYFFSQSGQFGAWNQKGSTLHGIWNEVAFGSSVALSEDATVLAVGGPYYDNSGDDQDTGHVRVFLWDSGDGDWVQRGLLEPPGGALAVVVLHGIVAGAGVALVVHAVVDVRAHLGGQGIP